MKLVGFLLMPAGWVIVLAAIALLPPGSARAAFLLAGLAVELFELGLAVRAHMPENLLRKGPDADLWVLPDFPPSPLESAGC